MDVGYSQRKKAVVATVAIKAVSGYPSYSRTGSGENSHAAITAAKDMVLAGFKPSDGQPFTATVTMGLANRKLIGRGVDETVQGALEEAHRDFLEAESHVSPSSVSGGHLSDTAAVAATAEVLLGSA